MATKNSNSSNSKSSSSKNSSSKSSGSKWGLNKFSFWLLCFAAIIYLVGLILAIIELGNVAQVLSNIAAAIMIGIVAYLAWRYVRPKALVWKILYIVVLLVIIVGLIIPLIK